VARFTTRDETFRLAAEALRVAVDPPGSKVGGL
jgi:hypothetical protein